MRLINIDSEFKKRKKSLIFQFYVTQNSRELRNIFNFQSHVKLDSFDVFFRIFLRKIIFSKYKAHLN